VSKKRQVEAPTSGNDGAWFLDMLGIERGRLISSTRRSHGDVEMPTLSPSASPAETTSEHVGQLWQATGEQDPLTDWEPHELAKQVTSSRNFRWTVIGALVILGVIAAATILWLPSIVQRRADARADEYRRVIVDLRAALPDTQSALATATDPAATAEDLSGLVGPLAGLSSLADRLGDTIAEPLPEAPPLLPSGPIEELIPIQDKLGPLGSEAAAIEQRISDLVLYRTLLASVSTLPDIPTEGSASDINELRVELAAFHADGIGIVNQMNPDPTLEDHLEEVRVALDRFADWQIDYLEAIREGDDAGPVVDEITMVFEALGHTIVAPLAEIRSETDARILDLANELDDTLVLMPS